MAHAGFLVPGFGTSVKGFGDQGKEDEEVRGDEPNKGVFISTNTTSIIKINNVVSGFFSTVLALSHLPSARKHSLSPTCRTAGPFSSLSDNHWN